MSTIFTSELILVSLALFLLLIDAFIPKLPKRFLGMAGALGVAWAFFQVISTPIATTMEPASFWYAFSLDADYIRTAQCIILISAFLTFILLSETKMLTARFVTGDSFNQDGTGELYILPLFATAGMMWMCTAHDFISLFVALELTTLSFYIMVGFLRRNVGSLEGGVKYLITGAMSAAVLIMGIAWYYGMTNSFSMVNGITAATFNEASAPAIYFSLGLILLGLIFKIGAVPMHIWVPDVYQGAPTPITAFLSVASKTAGLCVLITFIGFLPAEIRLGKIAFILSLIALATIFIGNLGAIKQTNVKRLLGYSSIGHAGYILPFFMLELPDYKGVMLYLFCYLPMTFGAFFILALIRCQTGKEDLNAFKGLGKRNPRLTAITTLMFASLAGVPLTGGFIAKFYAFKAMAVGHTWLIMIFAVIAAAAGFYYYFKPIRAMYWDKPEEGAPVIKVSPMSAAVLAILSISVVYLGVQYMFEVL